MYNYNFGGIKGTGPTGLTVAQRTKEGWGKTERSITDHFRAYESAQDGASDYVKLLMAHYPEAVTAANRGDASGFVRGLKQRGYFTGDEQAYERSVKSISAGLLEGNYSAVSATRAAPNASSGDIARMTAAATNAERTQVSQLASPHSIVAPLVPAALVSAVSTTPEATDSSRNPFADEVVRAALFEPSRSANPAKSGSSPQSGNQLVG
jgi:hypothetical protein